MNSLFEMPFREVTGTFSQWAIPVVMLVIVLWAAVKRVPMYESFVTGAKEGFDVAVMIIPYLVAILVVIKVFIASGAFDDIKMAAVWALELVGLSEYTDTLDVLPLALIRPLSGSGAHGILNDIYSTHGPDSFVGLMASLMTGSTETTFYILTVYFGAVQVKKMRHTLAACLIADAAGLLAAVVLAYLLFG